MIQPLFVNTVKKFSSNVSALSGGSNISTLKEFAKSPRGQPRTVYPLTALGGSEERIIEEQDGDRRSGGINGARVEERNEDKKKRAIHVASETVVGYESRRASLELRDGGGFHCSVSANESHAR